jgi:hypothetical protein
MTGTLLNKSAGTWDSEVGAFISESHRHVAEILHDYNRGFSLVWVPPKDRTRETTDPFAIIHRMPDGSEYVAMWLTEREMDNPQEVLRRVFMADTSRTDVLANLEAAENARQLLAMKAEENRIEEQLELIEFMVKTPLHQVQHNGRKFDL